jgi:hypothetical protein
MFQARIELATSLKSCLSQLLGHAELWLTVAQQKLLNMIPHNCEKCCKQNNHCPAPLLFLSLVPVSSWQRVSKEYRDKWNFPNLVHMGLVIGMIKPAKITSFGWFLVFGLFNPFRLLVPACPASDFFVILNTHSACSRKDNSSNNLCRLL